MTNTELKMVGLEEETKFKLDKIKIHPRETYDDIVQRLITESGLDIKR